MGQALGVDALGVGGCDGVAKSVARVGYCIGARKEAAHKSAALPRFTKPPVGVFLVDDGDHISRVDLHLLIVLGFVVEVDTYLVLQPDGDHLTTLATIYQKTEAGLFVINYFILKVKFIVKFVKKLLINLMYHIISIELS